VARLENVLDSRAEGSWMARALDAERDRDAAIAVVAYIIDRAEQYSPSHGYQTGFIDIAKAIANDEHLHAWHAGELDDLIERAESLRKKPPNTRAAATQPAPVEVMRGSDGYDPPVPLVHGEYCACPRCRAPTEAPPQVGAAKGESDGQD